MHAAHMMTDRELTMTMSDSVVPAPPLPRNRPHMAQDIPSQQGVDATQLLPDFGIDAFGSHMDSTLALGNAYRDGSAMDSAVHPSPYVMSTAELMNQQFDTVTGGSGLQAGSVLGGPMTQPMVGMHMMDSNTQMYAQSSTLAYFDTIGQPLPGGAVNHPTANRTMTSHGHGMGQSMCVGGLHANNLGMQMLPRVQHDNDAPATTQPGGDFPQIMPSTLPPPAPAPADVPKCQLDFFPSKAQGANKIGLLASHNCSGMPVADMTCQINKGFKYIPNQGVVCHKKNHFQVTVSATIGDGIPTYVVPYGFDNTEANRLIIDGLEIHMHGAKDENVEVTIPLVQSTLHRTKETFKPAPVEINHGTICQKVCRLHFTTTTANNMRKKGRPNPDQKFFVLVVSLYARVGGTVYLLKQIQSGKMIVRASNPTQNNASQVETWAVGETQRSIQHRGTVGINFVGPEEALVLGGNAKVIGDLYQPSDIRIKEDFADADTEAQLVAISKVELRNYDFVDSWKRKANLDGYAGSAVGVMAQDLKEVIPGAVKNTGIDYDLDDGSHVDGLLMVRKDLLAMEVLGAAQGMAAKCDALGDRLTAAENEFAELSEAVETADAKDLQTPGMLASILETLGLRT